MVVERSLDVAPRIHPPRCAVMGVLNVTPDSFSDGGRWLDANRAIRHGHALLAAGADLLDVGGESTRPGARRIDEGEEHRRVLPVIKELAQAGAVVSVDTMRARVAAAGVQAGAAIVNDVSAAAADPDMARTAADLDVPFVAMHWRGHSDQMDNRAEYDDVVIEVRDELAARVEHLLASGVRQDRIVLDPGLGFAKQAEHNWQLLRGLDVLQALGFPVLVGASRKRFLGAVAARGAADEPEHRDDATAAVSALAAAAGVWAVRVHQVRATAAAVRVAAAWTRGG